MSDKSDEAPASKKKGKLGKILMMGGLFVVLVGGGAGAGMYATRSGMVGGSPAAAEEKGPKLVPKSEQKAPATEGGGSSEAVPAAKGAVTPKGEGGDKYASNYYPMEKDFTANLQNSVHFIQVGIAVSTPYDETVIDHLKSNDIAVRSAILMALGDTSEEQVFTSQGKQQLARRLTGAINGVLQQKEGFGGVSNVYFTNFVVQ